MKTKRLVILSLLMFSFVASPAKQPQSEAITTGTSLTELGNYTIIQSDKQLVIKGETYRAYQLIYEFANKPVTIGIHEVNETCRNFIIKTDDFTLVYICQEHVFGSSKLDAVYDYYGKKVDHSILDPRQKFAQRIITCNEKTETQLLGLIACYFPDLLKAEIRAKI